MAGHFHFKGVHLSFGPRHAPPHHHDHHYGLYAAALALLALAAFAWTRQPVLSLLPIPRP